MRKKESIKSIEARKAFHGVLLSKFHLDSRAQSEEAIWEPGSKWRQRQPLNLSLFALVCSWAKNSRLLRRIYLDKWAEGTVHLLWGQNQMDSFFTALAGSVVGDPFLAENRSSPS